jgi:hypothetical protein
MVACGYPSGRTVATVISPAALRIERISCRKPESIFTRGTSGEM